MGVLIESGLPCTNTKCDSSDAFALYEEDDGKITGYCFSCHKDDQNPNNNYKEDTLLVQKKSKRTPDEIEAEITRISELPSLAIPHRGISQESTTKYGVKVEIDTSTGEVQHWYYPRYSQGKLVGYKKKFRTKEGEKKLFDLIVHDKDNDFFGANVCGSRGKMVVLTEGEDDTLAAWQMFKAKGKNYRICSLPDGANMSAIRSRVEWLESFETIVLAIDQDEAGQRFVEQVKGLLAPGSVKVMSFSEKDANKMLQENKTDEFFSALNNSTIVRPDGIVSGIDTWDKINNREVVESIPYPDGWDDLNKKSYGVRLGELDTWTSGSGMGKTQVLRELQYHLLNTTDRGIGVIALEEPLEDSVEAMMSLHLNKRYHLPDVRDTVTEEEKYDAWLATSGTNRLHYYDHFGSVDDDSLVSKIKFMARGLGVKYIFLDHLSIVVSEFADQGGERERIDSIMTKLKKLTQELGIWIGLVVHLRKVGGGISFEEGAVPCLDDLRGSGSIKQLSNSVYALSRNQQAGDEEERNTSQLHVLKCRFTGRTGASDYLKFDDETGRMTKTDFVPTEEKRNEF